MENEITVLIECSYDELDKILKKYNFYIKDKYRLEDIYMINKNINLQNENSLEILKNCVLVRYIPNVLKMLVYKKKEYAKNGDIINQEKIECPIENIDKAIAFMESINYEKLLNIIDDCIIYVNEETELTVQLVNNKYIFIEMEQQTEYLEKNYETVDDLKKELNKYDLPYNKNNYFIKKAELILKDIMNLE